MEPVLKALIVLSKTKTNNLRLIVMPSSKIIVIYNVNGTSIQHKIKLAIL